MPYGRQPIPAPQAQLNALNRFPIGRVANRDAPPQFNSSGLIQEFYVTEPKAIVPLDIDPFSLCQHLASHGAKPDGASSSCRKITSVPVAVRIVEAW